MELKKTKKANIERHRGMFFQVGMLIALGIVLAAFEWGVRTTNTTEKWQTQGVVIEQDIINTVTPEQPHQAPPPVNPTSLILMPDVTDIPMPEITIPDVLDPEIFKKAYPIPPEDPGVDPVDPFTCQFPPRFQNGDASKFQKWVMEQIKYPELAIQNHIEGKVFVSFVIDKKGNISNITVTRGVDESVDNETVRVLKKSPKWEPGLQNGKAVSVRFSIPVTFKLQQ